MKKRKQINVMETNMASNQTGSFFHLNTNIFFSTMVIFSIFGSTPIKHLGNDNLLRAKTTNVVTLKKEKDNNNSNVDFTGRSVQLKEEDVAVLKSQVSNLNKNDDRLIEKFDNFSDKVDKRFDKVDTKFDQLTNQIMTLMKELSEQKGTLTEQKDKKHTSIAWKQVLFSSLITAVLALIGWIITYTSWFR